MSRADDEPFVTKKANERWREIEAELDRQHPDAPGTNAFLAERRVWAAIEHGEISDRLDAEL
jgi:hypothetical protein